MSRVAGISSASTAVTRDGQPRVWVVVTSLALLGGVLPVLLAQQFGAFDIPRNDDWAYLLSAFRFADSGELSGGAWASMSLVGQLVLVAPVVWVFGHQVALLQLVVAALGVVGLLAVYDLGSRVLAPRRGLFVAALVAVGPLWAGLSVTFMTDVPAFALSMVCLALGARALGAEDLRTGWFAAALAVGLFAFTIREFSLVAPVVCCAAAGVACPRWPRRSRAVVAGATVALAVGAVVFFVWHRGLPGFEPLRWSMPTRTTAESTFRAGRQSASLIGLMVLPAVVLAGPVRILRRAWRCAPVSTVVIGGLVFTVLGLRLLVQWRKVWFVFGPGNYVMHDGILGAQTMAGQRSTLLPLWVTALAAMAAAAAFTLVVLSVVPKVWALVDRVRRRELRAPSRPTATLLALAAAGYSALLLVPLVGPKIFDRYLLPIVPLYAIGTLVAAGSSQGSRRATLLPTVVAFVAVAAFGAVYSVNSASYDGTRWDVAERAADRAGVDRVDGGFEWTNWHAGEPVWPVADREDTCIQVRVASTGARPGDVVAEPVWGIGDSGGWIRAVRRRC